MNSRSLSLPTPWARFISMHPEKPDISIFNETGADFAHGKWKIFHGLNGEVLIKNLSALYLQVNEILLEIDQEKELFGGERLAFHREKDLQGQRFDYVFCFMKFEADLRRNRDEILESEKMKKLVKINLPNEVACPICTNFQNKCLVLVPCQHSLCSFCLFDHLKLSSLCPLCRVEAVSVAKNPVLSSVIQLVEDSFSILQKAQERKELEEISLGGMIVRNTEGVYIGSCVNGKKDGQGKLIYRDGRIYEGSWENDRREGKGVMILANGDKYDGSWKNNRLNGKGKYLWKDGQVYEGNFQDDCCDGYGTRRYQDGRIYQGNWKNNQKEGHGILTLSNADKYEGRWVNGVLQPEVKVEYSNGDKYEGEIDVDSFKKQGKGILILHNGDKYQGTWIDNMLLRQVTVLNGDTYDREMNVEN